MKFTNSYIGALFCMFALGILFEGAFWITLPNGFSNFFQTYQTLLAGFAAAAGGGFIFLATKATIQADKDKYNATLRNSRISTLNVVIGRLLDNLQTLKTLQTRKDIKVTVNEYVKGFVDEGIESFGHFNLETLKLLQPHLIAEIRQANRLHISFQKNLNNLAKKKKRKKLEEDYETYLGGLNTCSIEAKEATEAVIQSLVDEIHQLNNP